MLSALLACSGHDDVVLFERAGTVPQKALEGWKRAKAKTTLVPLNAGGPGLGRVVVGV